MVPNCFHSLAVSGQL